MDVVIISIAVAVAVTTIALLIGLRSRRRMFAGVPRDRWQEARRGLSGRERRQVRWATSRRQPVSSARLAPAQLALASYAQDTAERSPLARSWWFRAGFVVLYALLTVNSVIEGLQRSQSRIFHFAMAALFAVLAVMWVLVLPRSLTRQSDRMQRLRAEINDRYGSLSV